MKKQIQDQDKVNPTQEVTDEGAEGLKHSSQHGEGEHITTDVTEDLQAGLKPRVRFERLLRIRGRRAA